MLHHEGRYGACLDVPFTNSTEWQARIRKLYQAVVYDCSTRASSAQYIRLRGVDRREQVQCQWLRSILDEEHGILERRHRDHRQNRPKDLVGHQGRCYTRVHECHSLETPLPNDEYSHEP